MTISAKVILHSVSEHGIHLYTLQLRYPKFIHGEAKTHRMLRIGDRAYEFLEEVGVMNPPDLSRNASSSRAIPVTRSVQDVIDDPAMPESWGKNQPGMQAAAELDDVELRFTGTNGKPASERQIAKEIWLHSRDLAVKQATALAKVGAHKQLVNRLIEPFCHINVVVTATEWANFFALRRHPDAQPEIHVLADKMFEAMEASSSKLLRPGQWHLPYVMPDDWAILALMGDETERTAKAIKISVARCARVSYLTHDQKVPNISEDLTLYDRLVGSVPLHASPCEHQATPDWQTTELPSWAYPQEHGNFVGWRQYRKMLPNERVLDR